MQNFFVAPPPPEEGGFGTGFEVGMELVEPNFVGADGLDLMGMVVDLTGVVVDLEGADAADSVRFGAGGAPEAVFIAADSREFFGTLKDLSSEEDI
jgi:hypothetical protein